MKKRHSVNLICALSATLVGCGSTGTSEIGRLLAAPLMTDCMNNATSYIYNNQKKEFDAAHIALDMPHSDDVTHIGKSIKSYLTTETESMQQYMDVLDKSPTAKVVSIGLSSDQDKITCDYIYFTDKNAKISQKPLLFKVAGARQTHYILADQPVLEISPIEYLFELPKSQQGFRLFNLEYKQNSIKPTLNNADVLKRIGDVVSSNNLLEFYSMDQPIQAELAIDLANYASSNLDIPTFLPQNPIHFAPPINKNLNINIDITDEENLNAKRMQQFNEERYVDPLTGINTTHKVLQQMRDELGLTTNRFKVSGDDADLSINTSNFTQEEIKQSRLEMKREQERQWEVQR